MAEPKFKFHILTGDYAQDTYNSMTKEPLTFYVLENGLGYLGEKLLFDAASAKAALETLTEDTANNNTLATSKAIIDYISGIATTIYDYIVQQFDEKTASDLYDSDTNKLTTIKGVTDYVSDIITERLDEMNGTSFDDSNTSKFATIDAVVTYISDNVIPRIQSLEEGIQTRVEYTME